MPQKRNPDVIELLRAHMRQVIAARTELMGVLRDLPSGYHRDFQLIKPPLFRAHDRMLSSLAIAARVLAGLTFDATRLEQVGTDPGLLATQRALDQVQKGVAFRDAYRVQSGKGAATPYPGDGRDRRQ